MTADDLADRVAGILEPVFTDLERVAELVAASREAGGADWSERDLAEVQNLLLKLVAQDPLTVGMGFVGAPGQVDGQERYMLWWQQHKDHTSRLRLNFDRSTVDVYDYLEMDWFKDSGPEHPRVAFGPYVDYSGSELYIITASVPVIVGGVMIGVAGADLLSSELERRLLGVLRESDAEALIVNSERRVVASNSARWIPGSRLKTLPEAGAQLDELTVAAVIEPPVGIGWLLAVTET